MRIKGCKVFSATKPRERDELGERVTAWIRRHPDYRMVDKIVTQSSDSQFHCITITVFYEERTKPRRTK